MLIHKQKLSLVKYNKFVFMQFVSTLAGSKFGKTEPKFQQGR